MKQKILKDIIEKNFLLVITIPKLKKINLHIVLARIEEILQLIFDNINFKYFSTTSGTVLKFDEETPTIIKKYLKKLLN